MPEQATTKTGTNVRVLAARVLAEVLVAGRSLDVALAAAAARVAAPGDRALLKAMCFGAVRYFLQLDAVLSLLLDKPLRRRDAELRSLLVLGLFQLEHMRIPPHAAVSETVNAAKALGHRSGAPLVNAVLRRYQRERDVLHTRIAGDEAARFAHPQWLIERLRRDWPDDWQDVLDAGNGQAPMWLRVNRARIALAGYRERLQIELGMDAQPCGHAPSALVLREPVAVDRLPGFASGLVSVQDAAAQLAAPLLGPEPGMRVLDACAAPGGKTCHLVEICPEANVVGVDVDAARLERVGENLGRLGLTARLVEGDACAPQGWWDGVPFERILLDAPCTATGVVRRHPDIKLLRREGDVARLAAVQERMLQSLWALLAPGGRLLYATCSVLADENQGQIETFLRAHPDAAAAELAVSGTTATWGRASGPGRQVLPGEDDMDGFHYACLHKR